MYNPALLGQRQHGRYVVVSRLRRTLFICFTGFVLGLLATVLVAIRYINV